jgi:glycosyltransferase involved in cell wall biosynthesis
VKRPTVSLAMIMKNEQENLPQLMKSVEGCFDEILIADTGSTDDSVAVAEKLGAKIYHFEWINDFAAARNFIFSKVKTDYVCWLDLDDVLENPEGFKRFRDDAMGLADYWIASYHYSSDATGKPVCSFARERVFRVDRGFKWKYFVHEGVIPNTQYGQVKMDFTPVWAVRHMRTDADLLKDRSRNLSIFETKLSEMDSRMKYYYGKELFEAQRAGDSIQFFGEALKDEKLEMHDRILCMQYLCYAYMQCNQFDKAIEIATTGLVVSPNRAEYYTIIGDCFVKMGRLQDAIPSYSAAKSCIFKAGIPQGFAGAIFHNEDAYTAYPRNQLARIYANLGDFTKSEAESSEAFERFVSEESKALRDEVRKMKVVSSGYKDAKPCDDIVITCPPQAPYLWDGEIYRQKSMGGSETACIEMAEWLHKISRRKVKVFNARETEKTWNGVEYIPCNHLNGYMAANKPFLHIAWRHNFKITDALTYLWCHDLKTPGAEETSHYEKLLCLTPFHKRYAMATQGIPEDKILVTRNGIKPDRFKDGSKDTVNPYLAKKNPNKIVFPSSPDRGLDRAMRVLDKVRETYPDIELHVFYGIEHLHKWGHAELQKTLETMMAERPWVKYHGATQQDVLMGHLKEASIWLHPCDFIETSCITAMEMIAAGVYPVTRRLGGLMDTLSKSEKLGMATLLDSDCITESEYKLYIDATLDALNKKKWETVSCNPDEISWESVAKEWLEVLPKKQIEVASAAG